jgi:hypothetical protein
MVLHSHTCGYHGDTASIVTMLINNKMMGERVVVANTRECLTIVTSTCFSFRCTECLVIMIYDSLLTYYLG